MVFRVVHGDVNITSEPRRDKGVASDVGTPKDIRKPDTPLRTLDARLIRSSIAPDFSDDVDSAIGWLDRTISNAITTDRMAVWGRSGKSGLNRIPIMGDITLSVVENKIVQRGFNASKYDRGIEVNDVHFSSEDINRIWPNA